MAEIKEANPTIKEERSWNMVAFRPSEEMKLYFKASKKTLNRSETLNKWFHRYKTLLQEHYVPLSVKEAQLLEQICIDAKVCDDNFIRYMEQFVPEDVPEADKPVLAGLLDKIRAADFSSRLAMIVNLGF